jgi:hypothetical protein
VRQTFASAPYDDGTAAFRSRYLRPAYSVWARSGAAAETVQSRARARGRMGRMLSQDRTPALTALGPSLREE